MSKVEKFLGDMKWFGDIDRPDDTDWRRAIELLKELDTENKQLQKQSDLLTLGLLQEKNKAAKL